MMEVIQTQTEECLEQYQTPANRLIREWRPQ